MLTGREDTDLVFDAIKSGASGYLAKGQISGGKLSVAITEVAAGAPSACQIFTLETASTLVSALVAFQDGNMRRFYTTYFDAAWAHYSPGVALLFEATRLSLAEGLGCDYMTGEQEYRRRRGMAVQRSSAAPSVARD